MRQERKTDLEIAVIALTRILTAYNHNKREALVQLFGKFYAHYFRIFNKKIQKIQLILQQ